MNKEIKIIDYPCGSGKTTRMIENFKEVRWRKGTSYSITTDFASLVRFILFLNVVFYDLAIASDFFNDSQSDKIVQY